MLRIPGRRASQAASRRAGAEAGFTLIEVMISLVLMSIVLMAGGGFMIQTLASSSQLAGRQGAVTVANQALEQIRAVNATFDSSGASALVYGRSQADVSAQWAAAAASGLDISGTYTGSGSTTFDGHTYKAGATITVPLQKTVTLGNQDYTVQNLIGTCVRALASTDCTRAAAGVEMFRAVVRVSWIPSAGKLCAGTACAYTASTLIDPSQDPVFNTSRKPVANNDSAAVVSGSYADIGVTVNDSAQLALSGAVTVITTPAHGTAVTNAVNNIVRYTPATGYSGTDSFTYTITDTSARTSSVATVTITVTPVGVSDSAVSTAGAAAFSTAVLGNDLGTGLSLVSAGTPLIGTAAISGTGIRYTPPAAASGIALITYTAQDSANQQYTSTLSITVKPAVPVAACWNLLSVSSYTFTASQFAGTGPFTLAVISSTSGVLPTLSGQTLSGLSLASTVKYTVTDANGLTSDPQTLTAKLGAC